MTLKHICDNCGNQFEKENSMIEIICPICGQKMLVSDPPKSAKKCIIDWGDVDWDEIERGWD